jgi:predicted AAA+ superfamily ATPase
MIASHILKEVILDQVNLQPTAPLVERELFSELENLRNTPFIIVITGLRRCGKSTLMQMIRKKNAEQDFFISFDDDRLATFELQDFQTLLECFIELYGDQKTIYLDEVQNIPEWERFVRRLHDQHYKIYITGSNALMFSKELGTRLTGRYLDIEMYPFSFKEFVRSFQSSLLKSNHSTVEKAGIKKLFNEYLKIGGLPEYIRHQTDHYLHTLYENILYKDIIARYRLTNERSIKLLVHYLASNVGKDTNFRQLGRVIETSSSSVADYCHYLEDCYLNFMVTRFSFSLKQQGYQKKSYFIDAALAQSVGFRMSEDRGRMLENIAFLELKRKGLEIYFYKENTECDFIIKKGNEIVQAIQVTERMDQDKTKKREIAGLLEAMQHFDLTTGLILTENEENELTETYGNQTYTIQIQPLWKWLLEGK